MSKSLGNVIAPQDVMKQSGADILRLWVVASDYAEDLRIGPEILKHMGDAYRRLRNTLRYLLGALAGFSPDESGAGGGHAGAGALGAAPPRRAGRGPCAARSPITTSTACSPRCIISARWICRRSISTSARTGSIATRADDPARRATRTVMDRTFDCLARWLAPDPVLHRRGSLARAARRRAGPQHPSRTVSRGAGRRGTTRRSAARWAELRDLRRVVTGALEVERAAKRIGSSLQAAVDIYVPERLLPLLREVDLAELCITSAGTARAGTPPEGAFTLPDAPGIGVVVSACRRARAASAAGGCCRRSAMSRA